MRTKLFSVIVHILAVSSLAGLPGVCRADSIWIEAESPSKSSFPPLAENPFRPVEFWENDILSGGDWIGMKWTDPKEKPFLEYGFSVKRPDTYHLYVRKFYTFGNFRWQVDGGVWHEISPIDHVPLESVHMRDADDRITLSWFPMGNQKLAEGRHTLRIEPIYKKPAGYEADFNPLGYDVILFTSELFFPNGSLKPWEKHTAQNSESFAWEPAIDQFNPCPIDWRSLNELVAGDNGGIGIKDGTLVFKNSLQPVRMVGANVSPQIVRDEKIANHLFRTLAKKGMNLVRFDISSLVSFARDANGKLTVVVDKEAKRTLLQAATLAKYNGLYSALTWDLKNSPNLLSLLWGDFYQVSKAPPLSPLLLFDKNLQDCVRSVWQEILNSSTKDCPKLASDPALALITLGQMETIFAQNISSEGPLAAKNPQAIEKAFAQWAAQRYGSLEKACERWGIDPASEVGLGEGILTLESLSALGASTDLRALDTLRFLSESQVAYFRNLTSSLKDGTGYQGLIATTNRAVDFSPALGWINALSASSGDVVERHGNYLPFFEPKYDVWQMAEGDRFKDRSALRFDPLPGQQLSRFDLPLKSFAFAGKPSLLSELNWPVPNRFRGEMPLLTTLLASVQDVQLIALNHLAVPYWEITTGGIRAPVFSPGILGQFPAFAFAYRNRLLPEGSLVGELNLSPESILKKCPVPLNETFNTQITAAFVEPPTTPGSVPVAQPALWATGKILVSWDGKEESLTLIDPGEMAHGTIIPSSGGYSWDYEKGLLRINAPGIKALGGFLAASGKSALGEIEITSPMEFGVIAIVALDGKPTDSSSKLLLQVFSQEANNGSYSQGSEVQTLKNIGRPPTMVTNFAGKIRFNRPDADKLIIRALDENGYPLNTAATGAELSLLPATMYYLIEK